MWTCKHCEQKFNFTRTTEKANHSKHCDKNPGRTAFYENLKKSTVNRFNSTLGEIKNFDVTCDCCGIVFTVKEREKRFPSKKQYFCSRNCSNSIGGKAKAQKHHYDEVAHYTTVAWRYHERKCLVCGEENVVAVHHFNEIHSDNRPENLVPLCPTHHQYMHSRYKSLIDEKVKNYVKEKWG
jgi:hypothetical protein